MLSLKLLLCREDARVLVRKLQVTLQTTRRVLRALAVVAMWQGHDQASPLHPLHLARSNELINDALSIVRKIAELGLPHDQSVGRLKGIAVFESESTEFAQG